MTEDEWLKYAKGLMTRPPMPWFNVRAMSEADLRALYQYVKSLAGTNRITSACISSAGQAAQATIYPVAGSEIELLSPL